jgi:uncharacterized protein YkwD
MLVAFGIIFTKILQILFTKVLFTLICNLRCFQINNCAMVLCKAGRKMNRRNLLILGLGAVALAGCGNTRAASFGASSGRTGAYIIDEAQAQAIPFRALDAVNAIRTASGLGQLQFSAELNASALTHARDMSVQNRPWHFGSDGSSPLLRAQRVGFRGRFLGELISETFETELQTINAWMKNPTTRAVLLDPAAQVMGFAWYQEPNAKIWWTLTTGA